MRTTKKAMSSTENGTSGLKGQETAVAATNNDATQGILEDPETQRWVLEGGEKGEVATQEILEDPETQRWVLEGGEKGQVAQRILSQEKKGNSPPNPPSGPPLPSVAQTDLQRGSAIQRPNGTAGAYLSSSTGQTQADPFHSRMLRPLLGGSADQSGEDSPDPSNVGLAVADVVNEAVVEAEEFGREHDPKRDTWKLIFGVGVLAISALTLILTFSLAGDKSATAPTTYAPTALRPTEDPSLAPSLSKESYVLSLLPKEFVPGLPLRGPQASALEWLVQDGNFWDLSDARMVQRYALATLYHSAGGSVWIDQTNWLSYDIHECQWHSRNITKSVDAVTWINTVERLSYAGLSDVNSFPCNEEEEFYSHLWLPANGLQGSLPDEVCLLTSLESIVLGQSDLDGTISTLLGGLTSLMWLSLTPSKLRGTIPTELGLLTDLQELFLAGTGLTGTIPSELGMLTNMKYDLSLEANELHGTIPSQIGLLSTAERVVFARNSISGSLPTEVGQMTDLFYLILQINSFIGPLPSELGRLTNLAWLGLNQNAFTGTIPTEFGLMNSTYNLYLFDNLLTGKLPSELGLIRDIGQIYPFDNELTGTIPTEIGLLSKMWGYYLSNTQMSGTIPTELGMLTKITNMQLNNMGLTGTIPTQLGRLSLAHDLEFLDNSLTGTIPSQFGLLADVTILNYNNNPLTGTIPSEFQKLGSVWNLSSFNISATEITGTVPDALCGIGAKRCMWWLSECGEEFDCSDTLCGCNCTCMDDLDYNDNTTALSTANGNQ